MKICAVGVEFFHVDGQKDRRDEPDSYSCQFCERT
jgi:hypothetical protein